MESLLFIPVILPFLLGSVIMAKKWKSTKSRNIYTMAIVLLNSAIVLALVFAQPEHTFTFFRFNDALSFGFRLDGLGSVFAALVAVLWPLATLYAFEYMEHENYQQMFFMFYTFTFGTTVGIAFAANLMTMYLFYEVLTLVTIPLVIQPMTTEARHATRKYLYYSLGGAAVAFIAIVFIMVFGSGDEFAYGGVLNIEEIGKNTNLLLAVYVLGFCGFGVKAALFPFHSWLPEASVAPTPVTALLHAVAVVKSGAFAIMRLTFFCFGTGFLRGTWAQAVVIGFAAATILYGSTMAAKEGHFKRRLAYSTISNLSYILFGVTVMTPLGLVGALCHMVVHAVTKICSFFCAGAVLHKTGRNYVRELDGIGKKMPLTFLCFTISALSLVGIPPLIGFVSKWNLAEAAVAHGGVAFVGMAAIFISAFLTVIYMFTVVLRAYFPQNAVAVEGEAHDPGWRMLVPLVIFAIVIVGGAFFSGEILAYFKDISLGIR